MPIMSVLGDQDRRACWHSIYLGAGIANNTDESAKHHAKRNKPDPKEQSEWFYLLRVVKFMETKS